MIDLITFKHNSTNCEALGYQFFDELSINVKSDKILISGWACAGKETLLSKVAAKAIDDNLKVMYFPYGGCDIFKENLVLFTKNKHRISNNLIIGDYSLNLKTLLQKRLSGELDFDMLILEELGLCSLSNMYNIHYSLMLKLLLTLSKKANISLIVNSCDINIDFFKTDKNININEFNKIIEFDALTNPCLEDNYTARFNVVKNNNGALHKEMLLFQPRFGNKIYDMFLLKNLL